MALDVSLNSEAHHLGLDAQAIAALAKTRRQLHQIPEIGFEEFKTAEFIAAELEKLDISHSRNISGTGIVATIKGDINSRRSIGFRAELDALPITENNDFEHRSVHRNAMHACGHDGHSTILLGLAKSLASNKRFAGTVRLIFQPAEEGLGGGKKMVDQGLFKQYPVDEIYAIHNWPELERATIGVLPGPVMASAHGLSFKLSGIGGHGGMPHLCTDQLSITAHVLTALNTYCARRVNPSNSVVISMTKIEAGTALTVTPESVSCEGVVRLLQPTETERLYREIPHLIKGIASAFGVSATIELHEIYPVTSNNPSCAAKVLSTAQHLGLQVESAETGLKPSMVSEDFSFMLNEIPGCYIWLGQNSESLHHPKYDFDDTILEAGINLLDALARDKFAHLMPG